MCYLSAMTKLNGLQYLTHGLNYVFEQNSLFYFIELRKYALSWNMLHDDVQKRWLEKVLKYLGDVWVIQLFHKLYLWDDSKIFLVHKRYNFANSTLLACSAYDFSDNAIIAAIKNCREMIKFEHMPSILAY